MDNNFLSFSEQSLKEITEASKNNKLIFFIGAGFSKLSETDLMKIPSWNELIDELKSELNVHNENDLLKIAQLYYLKFGEHRYTNKIKSSIKDLPPSTFHKELFNFNPRYIITTNWDRLIEKTIENLSLAYDLIRSDTELAHSQLDKKIIKMHGDFTQYNFVFKEDDYLLYSQNFPLIENYIKGIFSTHTIVFLGYSYSDYNLKQIISWISNISKATPQKYILQISSNEAQEKYLSNHGITPLIPLTPIEEYPELYRVFFEELRIANDPKKLLIKEVAHYSRDKESTEEDNSSLEKTELDLISKFLYPKIKKYLDTNLEVLTQYKALLPEQISQALTNCTIDYRYSYRSSPAVVLTIHKDLLTADYNKNIRKMNEIYINGLFNQDKDNFTTFKSVLSKGKINALIFDDQEQPFLYNKTETDNQTTLKLCFKYQENDPEMLLINKNWQDLVEFFSSKVGLHLSEKNYILATIHMFNHDLVYDLIEQRLANKYEMQYETFKVIIEKSTRFNHKNKARDFPLPLQNNLQNLIQILDLNGLYKSFYQFTQASEKNKMLAKSRVSGGLAWSSGEYTIRARLYPHVYFIIENSIFIEHLPEVKYFFSSTLLNSFKHYLIEQKFCINTLDLFILIKYCSFEELSKFTKELRLKKDLFTNIKLSLKEIASIKRYLLKITKNISQLFNFKDPYTIHITEIDNWFNKLLIVLGFVKWKSKEFETIIQTITPVFEYKTKNIDIYYNIIYLLEVNLDLYDNLHPSILNMIDIMLNKIIKKEFNNLDNRILDCNFINNICSMSKDKNHIYENINLLDKVLNEIKNREINEKRFLTGKLLLSLKNIGNQEIGERINRFIETEVLDQPYETHEDYISILLLIAHDYSMPPNFINDLELLIEETQEELTDITKRNMLTLLKILTNEKNRLEFEKILQKLESTNNQDDNKS